jgi:hypothetical protein
MALRLAVSAGPSSTATIYPDGKIDSILSGYKLRARKYVAGVFS